MRQGQDASPAEFCQAYNLGMIGYNEALRLQDKLLQARRAGEIPDTILFLQHPSVLTIGASGGEENIIASTHTLAKEGVAIVHTDRGGNITYHGPGQLVGYLIFDLKTRGGDLHRYMRNLEEVIIGTLSDFNIAGNRDSGYPGVWVGQENICAVGIRVSHWVTKHGFALNINSNLEAFSYINPCGIPNMRVTSMCRLLGHKLKIEEVISSMIRHFSQVFDIRIE